MKISLIAKLKARMLEWLSRDGPPKDFPLCDFDRIMYEVRPGDVLLTEGRSRISEVIKTITQSSWSHAALYIGRLHDIENPILRERIKQFYDPSPDEQMIIESMLGKGTIVSPLVSLKHLHVRICRPKGIARQDAQRVIAFAIGRLGKEYGIRHNLDLARFLFPWSIMPRRWRSTLFEHNVGEPTKEICSSMLAEAFASVNFPVLPIVKTHKDKGIVFYRRNPKLFTPSDFDYSPYFEIIKYPMYEIAEESIYRKLPWSKEQLQEDQFVEIPEPHATVKPVPYRGDDAPKDDNQPGTD